jgi:hypothetical protein
MNIDPQALGLLKRWRDQGRLTEAEYQAEVAALEGSPATFDQREQTVQQQINVAGDYILQQASQPGASAEILRQAYLHRVLRQTRGLPLTGVDRKAAEEEGNGEVQLAAVYTALAHHLLLLARGVDKQAINSSVSSTGSMVPIASLMEK